MDATTVRPLGPPQDLDAEMSLLGSLMLDNHVIGEVVPLLDHESFYKTANQKIFKAILELYDKRSPIDLVTLTNELEKRGILEEVGDREYLHELEQCVPSAAHAEHYAQIVREKAVLRYLITVCNQILRDASHSVGEPDELLDRAERLIFEAAKTRKVPENIHIKDILKQAFSRIEDLRDRKVSMAGLPTGFSDLDERTSGFQPSHFIVIAGRPAMGKTSLAMRIAEHVALKEKKPVAFFTMEMDAETLARNIACSHAGISPHDVQSGKLSNEKFQEFLMAAGRFQEVPLWIHDSPGLTPLELRARARRFKADHKIELLIIDYLQLLELRGFRQSDGRQQEVAMISRQLKSLAHELEIPVVALCQLRRAAEEREGGRPRLSDLRESGAIEQDADVVLLLHRPEYYKQNMKPGICEVHVAKQRSGPTGMIELSFNSRIMRFGSLAKMAGPEPT